MTSNWRLGLGFALITCVMWGLLPLALTGVVAVMDPITIAWYRFSLSAVIALAWYGYRSGPSLRKLLSPGYRLWSALAVLGLLGNYVFYVWGLAFTNPGATQIIIQIAPLLLLIASVFAFREPFQKLQWLGVTGVALGLLLFFNQRVSAEVATDSIYRTGGVLVLVAAVMWTCYGLAQKRLLSHFHAKDILLLICLGGSVLLLPFSHPAQISLLDSTQLLLLLFAGVNTIISYGAFGLALSYWEASRVSAIVPLAPLLTLVFTYACNTLWEMNIATEPLNGLGGIGAALVVAGSALVAAAGHSGPK